MLHSRKLNYSYPPIHSNIALLNSHYSGRCTENNTSRITPIHPIEKLLPNKTPGTTKYVFQIGALLRWPTWQLTLQKIIFARKGAKFIFYLNGPSIHVCRTDLVCPNQFGEVYLRGLYWVLHYTIFTHVIQIVSLRDVFLVMVRLQQQCFKLLIYAVCEIPQSSKKSH